MDPNISAPPASSLIRQGSAGIKQTMELLLQGGDFEAELDEQVVFDRLNSDENAIWSLLLATGYLRVTKLERRGRLLTKFYTLRLTNMEIESLFSKMIRGWFGGRTRQDYNDFVTALLTDDTDAMNEYINKVSLQCFSYFDLPGSASCDSSPERFYHGFVLGLMVELQNRFRITSNREERKASSACFGRYDVMLVPLSKEKGCAYIFEFKVHKPQKEKNLQETVSNALAQIHEKSYETGLIAEDIPSERIRKYGFAFHGKKCLIGSDQQNI